MIYIYVLKCPESGSIRYVGKAKNIKGRLRQHCSEARLGKVKSHKCSWIQSLLKKGMRPVLEIDAELPDGADWKTVEVERIAHFKSLGFILTNSTPGGDEPGELSEAGRMALAESARQRFGSPSGRVIQSERMKKLCECEEWRRQRDLKAKESRGTEEYRQRMSERSKKHWQSPEYRKKLSSARKALAESEEFRAKLSSSAKAAQSSPEFRKMKSDQMKAVWAKRKAEKAEKDLRDNASKHDPSKGVSIK